MFFELLTGHLRSLRPLVIALFPGQQRRLNRLKKMRVDLANELTELINELGPKLWDDFDHVIFYLHFLHFLSCPFFSIEMTFIEI